MSKKTNITGEKTLLIIAILVFLADRITKFLIIKNLKLLETIPIIKNVFHITFNLNTGAAFSIFSGNNILFIWFYIIFFGIIIYLIPSIKSKNMFIYVGLVIGGLAGNLFDRLFYGAVIDFIDFRIWPRFNIADSAIVIGGILIAIYLIREDNKENKNDNSHKKKKTKSIKHKRKKKTRK